MLRAAEPEPMRAHTLSWEGVLFKPSAASAAVTSAAKAEALEASPAAVGKSLTETTWAFVWVPAWARMTSKRRETRLRAGASASEPFNVRMSEGRFGEKVTDVKVERGERVRERLPVRGRLKVLLRLPQYLTKAILANALTQAEAADGGEGDVK